MKEPLLSAFSMHMSSSRKPDQSLDGITLPQSSATASETTLETLMESVNLESIVPCQKGSIEYRTISKILSFSPIDINETEDEILDLLADPQPLEPQLVQDPFTDTEHAHAALFRFLFEPLDSSSDDNDPPALTLTDGLIGDLQDLKDRLQYRYNTIRRNIVNGRHLD